MGKIEEAERRTYEEVWGIESYGVMSPGERWADAFVAMTQARDGYVIGTVLDAGCGSGKGAIALEARGYDVTMIDITRAGLDDGARCLPFVNVSLWDDLQHVVGAFDYVFCCDVMEHLQPAFSMLAVTRMIDVARVAVFLSISLVPDNYGAMIGRPLHLTVESFSWWKDRLGEIGEVLESRDCLTAGLYLVKGRAA